MLWQMSCNQGSPTQIFPQLDEQSDSFPHSGFPVTNTVTTESSSLPFWRSQSICMISLTSLLLSMISCDGSGGRTTKFLGLPWISFSKTAICSWSVWSSPVKKLFRWLTIVCSFFVSRFRAVNAFVTFWTLALKYDSKTLGWERCAQNPLRNSRKSLTLLCTVGLTCNRGPLR